MFRILIVDDESSVRNLIRQMLEVEDYDCVTAENAADAMNKLVQGAFDLVISDISMPGESGFNFLKKVLPAYPNLATVFVTAMDDVLTAQAAFEMGVYDYVTKPFDHSRLVITVANALRRRELEMANRRNIRNLEKQVAERTGALNSSMNELRVALNGTVRAIAKIVDQRDPYTAGHQRRVANLSAAIAEKMGLEKERRDAVRIAGLLHDLGKIFVPAEILSKPGSLSKIEYLMIKEHPENGFQILKDVAFPWQVAKAVLQHHERLDGSGYPNGLKDREIIPEARIIAVADVMEAMASHRPYRPAMGIQAGLEEIAKSRGTLYDSEVAAACEALFADNAFVYEWDKGSIPGHSLFQGRHQLSVAA